MMVKFGKNTCVLVENPFYLPHIICLKLNVDWIQPFQHTQYSMGIIYLAIENFP